MIKKLFALLLALSLVLPVSLVQAATGCNFPTSYHSWSDKATSDFLTVADVNQRSNCIENLQPFKGSADAVGYAFNAKKSRGSIASPTVITAGDDLLTISGFGYVGATNTYVEAAQIRLDSAATISDSSTGISGQIIFATRASGGSLTDLMTLDKNGMVTIGAASGNANMTVGVTVKQGANDDEAFAVQSTDVAHGRTAIAETSTWFSLKKANPLTGGARIESLSENAASTTFQILVRGGTPDTVASTTAAAGVHITLQPHDNANAVTNLAANALVFAVTGQVGGADRPLFFVDAEGDLFVDGSTTLTAFDHHDDIRLLTGFRASLADMDHGFRIRFASLAQQSRPIFERHGIATYKKDGTVDMINLKSLLMLAVDATRQVGGKVEALEESVKDQAKEIRFLKHQLNYQEASYAH